MKKINVKYPTTLEVVIKTAKEMVAMGYEDKDLVKYVPVNRQYAVSVTTPRSREIAQHQTNVLIGED